MRSSRTAQTQSTLVRLLKGQDGPLDLHEKTAWGTLSRILATTAPGRMPNCFFYLLERDHQSGLIMASQVKASLWSLYRLARLRLTRSKLNGKSVHYLVAAL
jgi:hypothetical protein